MSCVTDLISSQAQRNAHSNPRLGRRSATGRSASTWPQPIASLASSDRRHSRSGGHDGRNAAAAQAAANRRFLALRQSVGLDSSRVQATSLSHIAESAQHAPDFRWLRCSRTPVTTATRGQGTPCLRKSVTHCANPSRPDRLLAVGATGTHFWLRGIAR